jgi:hypothetical protein
MFSYYRLIKSELSDCDKPLVKGATKELVNMEEQDNIVSHGICCNVSNQMPGNVDMNSKL